MHTMKVKFEMRTSRVERLCFHPSNPWILTSHSNGEIKLWEMTTDLCLGSFQGHNGPVRSINFNATVPYFVSGGDDHAIKIWDYALQINLFTLHGHIDRITSVQFHQMYPWILSASKDQTIRIWNWQSRDCVYTVVGHTDIVTSAQFHPSEDLFVSSSHDCTVRVWDFFDLRKSLIGANPSVPDERRIARRWLCGLLPAFVWGVVVKFVLEGHEQGVNWAVFHPCLPLILSGGDDALVKLWRIAPTKAWEVATMNSHISSVTTVLFHPTTDFAISSSLDGTIVAWNLALRDITQHFRHETGQAILVLASHPTCNLLAVGVDECFTVFKIHRERPPYCNDVASNRCFYVKRNSLRAFNYEDGVDRLITELTDLESQQWVPSGRIDSGRQSLSVNPFCTTDATCNLLLTRTGDEYGFYALITISTLPDTSTPVIAAHVDAQGRAKSAAFVDTDRFVILDNSDRLVVKCLDSIIDEFESPLNGIRRLLFGGVRNVVLIATEGKLVKFDLSSRTTLDELLITGVKHVYWNHEYSLLAVFTKRRITLVTNRLEVLFSSDEETTNVKSGCWDNTNTEPIFIYSTLTHLKFITPAGGHGVIRGLSKKSFVLRATNSLVHYITHMNMNTKVDDINPDGLLEIELNAFAKQCQPILNAIIDTDGSYIIVLSGLMMMHGT